MIETIETKSEGGEDRFYRQKHVEPENGGRYIFWNPVRGILKIFHLEDYETEIDMLKAMDTEMKNWSNW